MVLHQAFGARQISPLNPSNISWHRLKGYLDQPVPSICLASSSRIRLDCAILGGRQDRRRGRKGGPGGEGSLLVRPPARPTGEFHEPEF